MKKYWKLLVFISLLIAVLLVLWFLRIVLWPFVAGLILTALLWPVIRWFEKLVPNKNGKLWAKQLIRSSILLLVYVIALLFITAIVFSLVSLGNKAVATFIKEAPVIIPNAQATIQNWAKTVGILSNPSVQVQINSFLSKGSTAISGMLDQFFKVGFNFIKSSISLILGFIIMVIFTFLLLNDWDNLRDKFYKTLPGWMRSHTKNIFHICRDVVVAYIRARIIMGFIIGFLIYIFLTILNVKFAVPLALLAGITELVPTFGPLFSAAIGILVILATAPGKVIFLALGYWLIQFIISNVVGIKIQGSQMKVHPVYVLILTIIGGYFAGILGFVIIVPVVMIIVNVIKYLNESTRNGEFI